MLILQDLSVNPENGLGEKLLFDSPGKYCPIGKTVLKQG